MNKKLYNAGAILLTTLGLLHTFYFVYEQFNPAFDLMAVLDIQRTSLVNPSGNYTLKSYYDGYSLTMGLLLVAYGVLARFGTNFTPKATIICFCTSLLGFVASVVFFHPLAYSFTGAAAVCFGAALAVTRNDNNANES